MKIATILEEMGKYLDRDAVILKKNTDRFDLDEEELKASLFVKSRHNTFCR